MKILRLNRLLVLIAVICLSALSVFADPVTIGKEQLPDGSIRVTSVTNNAETKIELKIDGNAVTTVEAHSSKSLSQIAHKNVQYAFPKGGSGNYLWKRSPQKKSEPAAAPVAPAAAPERVVPNVAGRPEQAVNRPAAQSANRQTGYPADQNVIASTPVKEIPAGVGYAERIYLDPFFGTEAVNAYTQTVDTYCRELESSANKPQYIIDNDIKQFLENSETELAEKKSNLSSIAQEIARQSNVDATQTNTINLIEETLKSRLKTREDACNRLKTLVEDVDDGNGGALDATTLNRGIIGAIIVLVIVIIAIVISLFIVTIRRKKRNQNKANTKLIAQPAAKPGAPSDSPTIVVRRRTTSILKKQCIDDVIDNPAYMVIKSSDFTPDSAVNKIYIKSSCIKAVYNLYAEDLRNTENPKEDGCMVLGRWVHDEKNHTYDVTLEEVVFPGDDAVFKEYELNFGGKIKLRIAEKLRKLRRDTNLQYDLVCWIHSHPGLGVFFSNSDDNVQMQLKHSQHPNFLVAFVVDILTSNQEMGIFTFRKDGSMNSKGDITKMFSLEEMYKWALKSELHSFSHDSYFNLLESAKLKVPTCKGVELNNNAIIDVTQIVIEPETGIVGWAVGSPVENKTGREFAVSSIVRNSEKPGPGIIGCLISMTHMSLPTIQRLIARDIANLSFVMVYSSKQMTLTTIPVVSGVLLSDEQFYGDVNIDDLKIWTRRRR